MQESATTRSSQASISAALAAASARTSPVSSLAFPGEDGGQSLAEMARRDLDATLQLLADRAQFITGANGAAIALRRSGKNDMLCRASTGSNVPELGALLSTEFGLSGESVRTRQPLRCDDAERDPRVNREGCRELGIASVVVMPVVNDDEVLGVFELFSGKVNAFGERDLSALQRLSEMVETAVKLAQVAETLPEQLEQFMMDQAPMAQAAATGASDGQVRDENILDDEILDAEILDAGLDEENLTTQLVPDTVPQVQHPVLPVNLDPTPALAPEVVIQPIPVLATAAPPSVEPKQPEAVPSLAAQAESAPKKPLFWSATLTPTDADQAAEADQSHVPPVLRNLRTCEACGFPVSPGRALCVECEEKKWRGQLKGKVRQVAAPETKLPQAKSAQTTVEPSTAPSAAAPLPTVRAFAAAAQSSAAPISPLRAPADVAMAGDSLKALGVRPSQPREAAIQAVPAISVTAPPARETAATPPAAGPSADFVLSAGLEPPQSWLAANKYIVGTVLLVAGVVAAIVLLH
jgi:hypothetical protein